MIPGAAWWLGDIQAGQTEVSIALAIGIRTAAEVQQVAEKLQLFPPPGLGLLLAAGDPIPAYVGDLTRYHPIPIEDIVHSEHEMIDINWNRLAAWVKGLLRGITNL